MRRVAAGLRYARSQAVTTGSDYQVIFNLEKGEITIECIGEEEKSYQADIEQEEYRDEDEEGRSSKRVETKKTYTLPQEVKLAKVIVDGEEITEEDEEEAWVDFYPNGSCSGGEIFLMDKKERVYAVTLEFLTGVVEITEEEEI